MEKDLQPLEEVTQENVVETTETVETTNDEKVTAKEIEAVEPKKTKKVKEREKVEPVEYPIAAALDFARQPEENMDTYGIDWLYTKDFIFAGNLRNEYTELDELAANILEHGQVSRAVVIPAALDCIPRADISEVRYGDTIIKLAQNPESDKHGLDAHRRILSIQHAQQNGINIITGTDEYGDEVTQLVKFPENYRIAITVYNKKINTVLERKFIQRAFNNSVELSQYDLLLLSMEAVCSHNGKRFLKPREIKLMMDGYLAEQSSGSANNFISAVGNIVRFIFGGEANMPQNPTKMEEIFVGAGAELIKLIRNNYVAVSSLGHALKHKNKHTKQWSVDVEGMVEFIKTIVKAENKSIDEPQNGNPLISRTKLEKWIKDKTAIEVAAIENNIAKAKGEEPKNNTVLKDGEQGSEETTENGDENGLIPTNPLKVVEDKDNPILNPFEETKQALLGHGAAIGVTVKPMYLKFLDLCSDVSNGEKTVGDIFTYFKQVELGVDISDDVADETDDNDVLADELDGLDDLPM